MKMNIAKPPSKQSAGSTKPAVQPVKLPGVLGLNQGAKSMWRAETNLGRWLLVGEGNDQAFEGIAEWHVPKQPQVFKRHPADYISA